MGLKTFVQAICTAKLFHCKEELVEPIVSFVEEVYNAVLEASAQHGPDMQGRLLAALFLVVACIILVNGERFILNIVDPELREDLRAIIHLAVEYMLHSTMLALIGHMYVVCIVLLGLMKVGSLYYAVLVATGFLGTFWANPLVDQRPFWQRWLNVIISIIMA
jgi:hypothetical protein